jgi:hypothetical protein
VIGFARLVRRLVRAYREGKLSNRERSIRQDRRRKRL